MKNIAKGLKEPVSVLEWEVRQTSTGVEFLANNTVALYIGNNGHIFTRNKGKSVGRLNLSLSNLVIGWDETEQHVCVTTKKGVFLYK